MRAEEGKVLKGIEHEHRPSLRALDGKQATGRRRRALEGNKPLDDWEYAYFYGSSLVLATQNMRHVPQIPQSVRASLIILVNFASLEARELVGSLRRPMRCWRRALACKIGTNTFAEY